MPEIHIGTTKILRRVEYVIVLHKVTSKMG